MSQSPLWLTLHKSTAVHVLGHVPELKGDDSNLNLTWGRLKLKDWEQQCFHWGLLQQMGQKKKYIFTYSTYIQFI